MTRVGDMLSQAEIDALLSGSNLGEDNNNSSSENLLSPQEIDALGEIGNISMGTSATTLFMLLGHKVMITTPKVTVVTWEELTSEYSNHVVGVRVKYTHGLIGSNLLIMKENDAKIISDLMMGGDGSNTSGELSELHLSAISEAMNQMVGSAATSMSSMFDKRIDISPPKAFSLDFKSAFPAEDLGADEYIVKIAFKMVVGNLIDSEIMQLVPISFAKDMVNSLLQASSKSKEQPKPEKKTESTVAKNNSYSEPQSMARSDYGTISTDERIHTMGRKEEMDWNMEHEARSQKVHYEKPVNVQPAKFMNFEDEVVTIEKKNIGLIMDVPLEITVELGRTQKAIKDILEFGPGSVIELEKLAEEPVDILVNGKKIAKGEVVVIDESFGVRITDIIEPSKRL